MQPKALISVRAKKFISIANYLLLTFTSKAHKGVFPTMIGLSPKQKVTKPIMVGKTPCKLLCAFEVKVSNKKLARYKLLGPN